MKSAWQAGAIWWREAVLISHHLCHCSCWPLVSTYTHDNHKHTGLLSNTFLSAWNSKVAWISCLLLEILVHCATYSINISLVQLVPQIFLFLTRIYSTISQQTGLVQSGDCGCCCVIISRHNTLCNTLQHEHMGHTSSIEYLPVTIDQNGLHNNYSEKPLRDIKFRPENQRMSAGG